MNALSLESSESTGLRLDCGGAALARRLAVRLGVAGVWREPQAAVDAAGRVGGLGDDDPSVAATIGGPLCGDAEQVGGQPVPPVLVVRSDALVARRGSAPDNTKSAMSVPSASAPNQAPMSRWESARRA
jgi:hypothetical protein